MLLAILLIFLVVQVQCDFKLIIAYGEPESFTASQNFSLDWDDCVTSCLANTSCLVIYEVDSENCQMFTVGQITSAKRLTNGNRIGVKMKINSTTCPTEMITSTASGSCLDSTAGTYQTYTTIYDNYQWTFSMSSILKCPTGFTMFIRTRGVWCMKVVNGEKCLSKTESVSKCKSIYGGVISGLETVNEYNFVVEKAKLFVSRPIADYKYGFWLDGTRKSTCMPPKKQTVTCNGTNEFSFADPTLSAIPQGYVWGSGMPDGIRWVSQKANCLVVQISNNVSIGVDDCNCAISGETVKKIVICYQGYVCGRLPMTLS